MEQQLHFVAASMLHHCDRFSVCNDQIFCFHFLSSLCRCLVGFSGREIATFAISRPMASFSAEIQGIQNDPLYPPMRQNKVLLGGADLLPLFECQLL
jgi:hypothetical protein